VSGNKIPESEIKSQLIIFDNKLLMKANRLLKITIIAGISFFLFTIILSALFYFSGYLSATKKVSANVLIVEGWLPPDGIKDAYAEYQTNSYDYIITTGIKSNFYYGFMHSNGFLIFYPREKLKKSVNAGRHLIEVIASSELNGDNAACFNLFINKNQIASFRTQTFRKSYSAYWEGSLSDIDSLMVEFTNDLIGDFGDRNLLVRKIIIDKKISIPTLNYSEYDIGKLDGKARIKNDYTSYALRAQEELKNLGIKPGSVISIPGGRTQINRTLSSALAVRNWMDTTHIDIKGINILSYGMHARRSWLIYSRLLGKNVETGVVSLPDKTCSGPVKRSFRAFRETLGIIYYRFILLFF
jgi:hypothetical protein